MNLFCNECLKVTHNNNIEIKHEIDGKINLYYDCINCGFTKFATIDKKELNEKENSRLYIK